MTRIRLPLLPGWLRWGGVAIVAAVVFYTSILIVPTTDPVVPGKPEPVPLDKWRHFLAYGAVAGSLAYATADLDRPRILVAIGVVGVTVLYGFGIEVGQSFLSYRYFSLGDAYANALGALLVTPWYLVQPHVRFWRINLPLPSRS